jgi:hypothetical protein
MLWPIACIAWCLLFLYVHNNRNAYTFLFFAIGEFTLFNVDSWLLVLAGSIGSSDRHRSDFPIAAKAKNSKQGVKYFEKLKI